MKIKRIALVSNIKNGYFKIHFSDYLSQKKDLFTIELSPPHNYDQNLELILTSINKYSIDLVFFALGLFPLKINQLDKIDCSTICFLTDDDWMFESRIKYITSFFNYVVTPYKYTFHKYKKLGISNIILSQWACNKKIFYPMEIPKTIDASFIGGPHGDRIELITFLKENGINIQIFGAGWKNIKQLRNHWGGYLSATNMVKVINRSKINLNPAMTSSMSGLQIKGRTFEIPGCRSFQLTENNPFIYDYFEKDKEIVTYDNYGDLVDKIKYYLEHESERESISQAAYKRVMHDHTWEKQLDKIFKRIDGVNISNRISPYLSTSSIDLIYVAQDRKKLNKKTIDSINSQLLKDITVYLISKNYRTKDIKYKIKFINNLKEAMLKTNGTYCAFIINGDTWEPEKLQMQSFALDHDQKNGININLTSYGVYFNNPVQEDIFYSLRHSISKLNCNSYAFYSIVPSSVLVRRDLMKKNIDLFIEFLRTGIMNQELQQRLGIFKNKFSLVDFQYSLARTSLKKIKKSLSNIVSSKAIYESFNTGWGWVPSGKSVLKKVLKNFRLQDLLKISYAYILKKPIFYYWLMKK